MLRRVPSGKTQSLMFFCLNDSMASFIACPAFFPDSLSMKYKPASHAAMPKVPPKYMSSRFAITVIFLTTSQMSGRFFFKLWNFLLSLDIASKINRSFVDKELDLRSLDYQFYLLTENPWNKKKQFFISIDQFIITCLPKTSNEVWWLAMITNGFSASRFSAPLMVNFSPIRF